MVLCLNAAGVRLLEAVDVSVRKVSGVILDYKVFQVPQAFQE